MSEYFEQAEQFFRIGDYQKAEISYKEAIKLNHPESMYKLALISLYDRCHQFKGNIDGNDPYDLFEKAGQLNHTKSLIKLFEYYENRDIKKAIQYAIKAYKLDPSVSLYIKDREYIEMYCKLEKENTDLKNEITELKYKPGGSGYLETKQHFDSLVN